MNIRTARFSITVQGTSSHDSMSRRTRVNCKVCGQPIELVRMKEHLRTDHQSVSSEVESLYLAARIEARRRRHS
ncbi:MAG: hypothetical protein ACLPZM_01105 [Thermoplasmata archaeon]